MIENLPTYTIKESDAMRDILREGYRALITTQAWRALGSTGQTTIARWLGELHNDLDDLSKKQADLID